MSADSFYVPDGSRFAATGWTRGPWSPNAQHAGPPSALLARAVDRLPSTVPMRVSRVAVEILKPIPLDVVEIEARVVRDGKRVQLCEAAVLHNGDPMAIARVWRIRISSEPIVPEFNDFGTLRKPDECPEFVMPWHIEEFYMAAMELRTVHGNPFQGPSAVWFKMRYPLIAGEEPTSLERVIIAADSGNGISAVLPFDHAFINVDVTSHLIREAQGEWVALDATTRIDPSGIGVSESFLHDERGRIGIATQSLFVDAPR